MHTDQDERPAKRLRLSNNTSITIDNQHDDDYSDATIISAHPLGVKPSGNAYASTTKNVRRNAGYIACLPDELIVHLLEFLAGKALRKLGYTCKALYAFATADELWRVLFVDSSPGVFEWRGSWRSTYLQLPKGHTLSVDCTGLYSDALYRPFQCSNISIRAWTASIPKEHQIPRMNNMTHEEYAAGWASKPFILTAPVKAWPIYGEWSVDHLVDKFPEISFRAEAVDWPLRTYVEYMRNQAEESPLYLFDRGFAEKMRLKVGSMDDKNGAAYWAPDCFGDDLFALLGEQRPNHRWLIVGPERSGSTFHKDPNATSAWNAVLKGCKYWLMFPSSAKDSTPPGVILSDDASEITSPISIAEYMLAFHDIARATPGCLEGLCHAGEILHVPSGWFHLVVNMDESVAITQNFVPKQKLVDVLRFMRDSPDQISGFSDRVVDPYGLFVDLLEQKYPSMLREALERLDSSDQRRNGTWGTLKSAGWTTNGTTKSEGFSFGFGSDSEDDEDGV